MHSFTDLNGYNDNTSLTYTDYRSAHIEFNTEIGIDQHIGIKQGKNHSLPLGLDILDIVNGSDLNIQFKINFTNFLSGNIFFGTIPDGITVVYIGNGSFVDVSTGQVYNSTFPDGVSLSYIGNNTFQVSGITTKAQWDAIKYPTIISNSSNLGDYNYKIDITYTGDDKFWTVNLTIELGVDLNSLYTVYCNGYKLISIPTYMLNEYSIYSEPIRRRIVNNNILDSLFNNNIIGNKILQSSFHLNSYNILYESGILYELLLSSPNDFIYTSGTIDEHITNTPVSFASLMNNNTASVVITPEQYSGISSISSSGVGGSTYLTPQEIYTISGTYSQINSHLNTLSITFTDDRYNYNTNLLYYLTDNLTGKHYSIIQKLIPNHPNTVSYYTNYDKLSSEIIFNNIPDIISDGVNPDLAYLSINPPNNQWWHRPLYTNISLAYINQNDNNNYSNNSTITLPSGYFTKISGDGKRCIQHGQSSTDLTTVYYNNGTSWISELSIDAAITPSTNNYERCDIDYYGQTVIIGNKIYKREWQKSSWYLYYTLPVNNEYIIYSSISNDGHTILVSTIDNSSTRRIKRYLYRTLSYNGNFQLINSWTSTGIGTFSVSTGPQTRIQHDILSKDGDTIFMSTADLKATDSGSYLSSVIKVYKFNYTTLVYDYITDIGTGSSLPLLTPTSCSANGEKLIVRYAGNPGSSYYMIPRLYEYNGSTWTYNSTIPLQLGSSNDNCATISGDGNIIIDAYNPSSLIRIWKYYNNTWNKLSDITESSSSYSFPAISYSNNFIIGGDVVYKKEYYNPVVYNFSETGYTNSTVYFSGGLTYDGITFYGTCGLVNNIKNNYPIRMMIPPNDRNGEIYIEFDIVFNNTQTFTSTRLKGI